MTVIQPRVSTPMLVHTDFDGSVHIGSDDVRSVAFTLGLTAAQKAAVTREAAAAGVSVSTLIYERLRAGYDLAAWRESAEAGIEVLRHIVGASAALRRFEATLVGARNLETSDPLARYRDERAFGIYRKRLDSYLREIEAGRESISSQITARLDGYTAASLREHARQLGLSRGSARVAPRALVSATDLVRWCAIPECAPGSPGDGVARLHRSQALRSLLLVIDAGGFEPVPLTQYVNSCTRCRSRLRSNPEPLPAPTRRPAAVAPAPGATRVPWTRPVHV